MRTSTLPTSTRPSARQRKRAANQEAGDKTEQWKSTEAGQSKRAANQEAGGKAGQRKNAEARQRKRAEIRVKSSQELRASAKKGLQG